MLSIFHVFCDTRTSGAVLFAQIWNLSRDFDVPLANSKASLCQLDNKLTRCWLLLSSSSGPGARFSKVPIINGPGKLCPFTLKIEVSIVLHLT